VNQRGKSARVGSKASLDDCANWQVEPAIA